MLNKMAATTASSTSAAGGLPDAVGQDGVSAHGVVEDQHAVAHRARLASYKRIGRHILLHMYLYMYEVSNPLLSINNVTSDASMHAPFISTARPRGAPPPPAAVATGLCGWPMDYG